METWAGHLGRTRAADDGELTGCVAGPCTKDWAVALWLLSPNLMFYFLPELASHAPPCCQATLGSWARAQPLLGCLVEQCVPHQEVRNEWVKENRVRFTFESFSTLNTICLDGGLSA